MSEEVEKMDKLREEYRNNIKRNEEIKEEIRELVKKALDNPICSLCGEEHKTPQAFIEKHGKPDMNDFIEKLKEGI